MNRWACLGMALLFVPQLAGAETSLDPRQSGYRGEWDRAKVFVVVEKYNGWDRTLRAGLASDGRLKLVGVYSDTTVMRRSVAADSALAFINELLALDFLGQPEAFRPFQGIASPTADGRINIGMRHAMDAGRTCITLHLGPGTYSVTLHWPAYGAPEALVG